MQVDKYENDIAGLERQGKTAMLMAIEGKMAGIVAVADTIKENFHEAKFYIFFSHFNQLILLY